MQLHLNRFSHRRPTSDAERRIVSAQSAADAYAAICQWPDYTPTPLHSLEPLAARLRVREVLYKDESTRFSVGSFKVLGGAYAAACEIQRRLQERGVAVTLDALLSGKHASETKVITLVCATDGNHGVAVAYAANRMGCPSLVFMHQHASASREQQMKKLGATVRRTAGTYDASVQIARRAAQEGGAALIADTSLEAFEQVPAEIIRGYTVMLQEVVDRHDGPPLTHVVIQGGVGGLAAACAGFYAEHLGPQRPTLIVVEPQTAACLLASAQLGQPAEIEGDLATEMGMLACGVASPIAWTILKERCDGFITIDDRTALRAQRILRSGESGHVLNVGVSGAAGIAGLLALKEGAGTAASFGLNSQSRVLVIGTEAGDSLTGSPI